MHFGTTLAHLNQPHVLNLHLEFLRRTAIGPGTFTVKDVKLGSRISTVHVSFSQLGPDGDSREEIVGYVSHSNLATEEGVTLDMDLATQGVLHPPPYAADLRRLMLEGKDNIWVPLEISRATKSFAKVTTHVDIYVPSFSHRRHQVQDHTRDEWMRFTPYGRPGKFTNACLGYVVDMFPLLMESFARKEDKGQLQFWSPSLSLNLEMKKLLPEEGVDWLFLRVQSKMIQNGRLDLETSVLDADGILIALSSQVMLVLEPSRNVMARGLNERCARAEYKESKI